MARQEVRSKAVRNLAFAIHKLSGRRSGIWQAWERQWRIYRWDECILIDGEWNPEFLGQLYLALLSMLVLFLFYDPLYFITTIDSKTIN
jgi:hypothetical protein